MKKIRAIVFGILIVFSLLFTACALTGSNADGETSETSQDSKKSKKRKKKADQGEPEEDAESMDDSGDSVLADTYWKIELEESAEAPARTVELFFFSDGTFHARDLRGAHYYSLIPFYMHHEAEESIWRLDDQKLELEFLTSDPAKRVIYNAEYKADKIIADDFIEGYGEKLSFEKQEEMPKLSSIEEDSAKLAGDWVEVLFEGDGNAIMVEDYFTPTQLQITGEDELNANMIYNKKSITGTPLFDESFQNAKITLKNERAYETALNEFWHGVIESVEGQENAPSRTLIPVDEDMLILERVWEQKEDASEEEAATIPYYYSSQIFLRKDSQAYQDREELKYRKTVTVSTVEELDAAIDSRTRIILKEGVYNFSELARKKASVQGGDSENYVAENMELYGIRNMTLEAEEGKKVEIVTENASLPVISLDYAFDIKFKGLTLGHANNPADCSGSVIFPENSQHIKIEGCYLYGSGTYGIDSFASQNILVENMELYDCTYGLLSFYDSSGIAVRNSILRDSKDWHMFYVNNTSDILIENTKIMNNVSEFQYGTGHAFISGMDISSMVFRNCEFSNNQYKVLTDDEENVTFENCSFNDRVE